MENPENRGSTNSRRGFARSRKEEITMYRKVLVPLDGSKLAEYALDQVKMMAREGFAGEVTLLNVVKIEAPYAELYGKHFELNQMRKAFLDSAGKYLADVQARLGAEGVRVKTEIVEADRPAPAITDFARKNGMELIVIATHGYTGLKKLMLGSVALSVLHDSHTPVLLIRPEACRA
jgi:nucleotide-binding universal stress UspA family protein